MMSFEQKRRLSIALGQLPGDKIAEVMRIVAEDDQMRMKVSGIGSHNACLVVVLSSFRIKRCNVLTFCVHVQADSAEEVEVDIDQLSVAILWKLEQYTTSVLQSLKKKSSHKPDAQGKTQGGDANGNEGAAVPNGTSEARAADHSSSSSSSGTQLTITLA